MDHRGLKPDGERFLPEFRGTIELEHYHRYLLALTLVAGKDVLDIASGEGFGSEILSRQARTVVGVDISTDAVAHASAQYMRENLRFIHGSATGIPIADKSVDVIVSFETIEHLAEHDLMMSELKRVLRPDGCLIISSPNKLVYTDRANYTNRFHVRELYTPDFLRLTARYFTQVRHYGQRVSTCSVIANGELEESFTTHSPTASVAGMPDQMYDVILASDVALPKLGASIFELPHGPLQPQRMEALAAEAALSRATVNRLEQDSEAARATINRLEREVQERRATVERQERESSERLAAVESLEREAEEARAATARLEREADEMRAVVARLEREAEGRRDATERLEREAEGRRDATERLEREAEHWRATLNRFADEIAEGRTAIERMENQLARPARKASGFGPAVYQTIRDAQNLLQNHWQETRRRMNGIAGGMGVTALRRPLWEKKHMRSFSRLPQLLGRTAEAPAIHLPDPHNSSRRSTVELPIRKHKLHPTGVRLAVVVHAFYLDAALEILKLLSNIEIPFSLFVSTTAENAGKIKFAVKANLHHAKLHLFVAPNRGRNFGPMLVEMRQALLEHDILLHLHTKQSLRTGEEQASWRRHILNHLVGSAEVVQTILKLYQDDPGLGVVGPANDVASVPYWCQYWLANSGLAQEWLPRFGVRHFPKQSLLDFPVGGMFWARTASIGGILAYPWKYSDFAPEPAAADGTVAHMLERAVGVASVCSGFKYGETNLESSSIRIGGSEKSLYQYIRQAADLKSDALRHSVISFDFYDTLFARLASSPEDVQHYVGYQLFSRGLVDDPATFFVRRKQSERDLREKSGYVGDVSLAEIFANITPTRGFGSMAIEAAYRAELDIELGVLVPRADLINLARDLAAHGRRLIIASDSYMPKEFFESVLRKFGLHGVFSEIYVSSEMRRRKDNGSLWQFFRDTEARSPGGFLHIGDNFRSDMQIPGDLGLAVFGVIGTSVLAKMNGASTPDLWDCGETDWRSGVLLGPQMAMIGNAGLSEIGAYPLRIESAHKAGYCVLGPLFFGFITWLTRRAESDGVERFYFLARDCKYLMEIYSEIRADFPELKLPEAVYLEVSRRAVLPAALAAGMPLSTFVTSTGHFSGSFGGLLESRLGVDQSSINSDDRMVMVDPMADSDLVLQLIERNKKVIFAHCNSSLELVTAYLRQNGLWAGSPLSNVALVDLGYSGTIQNSLQFVLEAPLKGYYCATSARARKLDSADGFATGYFGNQAIGGDEPDMYRYSLLIEAFLLSSSGSVVSYTRDQNEVFPLYGPLAERTLKEREMLQQCIDGTKKYFADLLGSYGGACLGIEFSPREAEKPFLALVRGDIGLSPELEACLTVEDDFCGNGVLSAVRHVRSMAGVE